MQQSYFREGTRGSLGGSAFDVPVAVWRRHQSVELRLIDWSKRAVGPAVRGQSVEQETHEFVLSGEGENYEPLKEKPEIFLAFAQLGKKGSKLEDALAFVQKYGLPWTSDRDGAILGLAAFAREAVSMSEATGLMQKVSSDRESRHRLAALLREHLTRVTLMPLAIDDPPVIASFYAPLDLLSAMWLQVLDTVVSHKIIREACAGCGQPFTTDDKRQRYCDPSCRHAHAQRDYSARKKARGGY